MTDSFRWDVFVSYSVRNRHRVDQIVAELDRAGLSVWIDTRFVRTGDSISAQVEEGLMRSRCFALCMTKDALESPWVTLERETALHRQMRDTDRRFLPILLDDCEIPLFLQHYRYVDWRNSETERLNELIESIKAPKQHSTLGPAPSYPNVEMERLAYKLECARAYQEERKAQGEPTDLSLSLEIHHMQSKFREGGQLNAGDTFGDGRYVLEQSIGRGGFGTVWRAFDRKTTDRVAIKFLLPDHASDKNRSERFTNGAAQMSKLGPGVVRVIEQPRKEEGFLYFVMELAARDLHAAIVLHEFDQTNTTALILRVAETLASAHRRGWIHRDVKPKNILLSRAAEPLLADFDLLSEQDRPGNTRTGSLVGTPVYMAPETKRASRNAPVKPSRDVFSLGMTAIFCFARRDIEDNLSERERIDLVQRLEMPEPLRPVLIKCIREDASQRYQDAAQLCAAIRSAKAVAPLQFRTQMKVDDRYLLINQLATDLMTTSWNAYDTLKEEPLVLKLLSPRHATDAPRREQFVRGARHAAELARLRLLPVRHDVLDNDNTCAVIHEQAPSVSLREAVTKGMVTAREVGAAGLHACRILAEMHERGWTHGSVRPDTIQISRTRAIWLTDIALYGPEDARSLATAAGASLYRAPELRITGASPTPTAASDVFGLALSIAFGLHGNGFLAKDAASAQTLVSKLAIPPAFQETLQRALEHEPSRRFANCREFFEALRARRSSKPTARLPNERERSIRPPGKQSSNPPASTRDVVAGFEAPTTSTQPFDLERVESGLLVWQKDDQDHAYSQPNISTQIELLDERLAVNEDDLELKHQLANSLMVRSSQSDGQRAVEDSRRAAELLFQIAKDERTSDPIAFLETALANAPDHEAALSLLEERAVATDRVQILPKFWVSYVSMAPPGPARDRRTLQLGRAYMAAGQVADAEYCLGDLADRGYQRAKEILDSLAAKGDGEPTRRYRPSDARSPVRASSAAQVRTPKAPPQPQRKVRSSLTEEQRLDLLWRGAFEEEPESVSAQRVAPVQATGLGDLGSRLTEWFRRREP